MRSRPLRRRHSGLWGIRQIKAGRAGCLPPLTLWLRRLDLLPTFASCLGPSTDGTCSAALVVPKLCTNRAGR
ncbi:hypothetical protein PUNSTDRAFT_56106 [Punctularia strigosozonata HHB-11173 SS5]|uniref:Uncharacterized protein n=1 Tax=Punctularia strigosozonata (strain HHB-11173) TaxID=741275 RepID=R7RZW1_PUNST|nr:uncharacterized protein PUNSTDRAFT_56106 [Punctularia strigosozonata HHB-11173 SS5]EIN03655.1 hypothetical protein PUNSTDRAFT_56106 [Punctularia strigosozonata HHB-11173 SS5]